ncbi:Non-catalytic module family EXPN protein [Lactarius sanguifluus]|nr:Non-catalytic module family EXPN protein [Lactarius sanguifluus]
MSLYSLVTVLLLASLYVTSASYLPSQRAPPTVTEFKYSRAHSLESGYNFDPRDGWQPVNISNLSYKYGPSRPPKVHRPTKSISKFKSILDPLTNVLKGLKGIGKPEKVTITWYTGHDLLNPSCWKDSVWAPTDSSFACALTREGWTSRPQCFQFLELCESTKNKCVFVRVVDTCAGCAKGSKHVDLTKNAFRQLADLEVGALTVQMRVAKQPEEWSVNLWGPKT